MKLAELQQPAATAADKARSCAPGWLVVGLTYSAPLLSRSAARRPVQLPQPVCLHQDVKPDKHAGRKDLGLRAEDSFYNNRAKQLLAFARELSVVVSGSGVVLGVGGVVVVVWVGAGLRPLPGVSW